MNEITTLFTAIGDAFTSTDWFAVVKWPFWVLLTTVAVGGIYCARFGKRTLLNQAAACTLTLVSIYLTAVITFIHWPAVRHLFSELPFLSVTDEQVFVADIFSMNPGVLAPWLLRLMLLSLMVSIADAFITSSKSFVSWLFSQIFSASAALAGYAVVTAGLSLILPGLLGRYAIIPMVIVLAVGLLMLCAKFIFTVIISGGNPYFTTIYKFFTVNKGGSLFTVSSLTFVFALILVFALHISGNTTAVYAEANVSALWIILMLVMAVLYLFATFFLDRKKA